MNKKKAYRDDKLFSN